MDSFLRTLVDYMNQTAKPPVSNQSSPQPGMSGMDYDAPQSGVGQPYRGQAAQQYGALDRPLDNGERWDRPRDHAVGEPGGNVADDPYGNALAETGLTGGISLPGVARGAERAVARDATPWIKQALKKDNLYELMQAMGFKGEAHEMPIAPIAKAFETQATKRASKEAGTRAAMEGAKVRSRENIRDALYDLMDSGVTSKQRAVQDVARNAETNVVEGQPEAFNEFARAQGKVDVTPSYPPGQAPRADGKSPTDVKLDQLALLAEWAAKHGKTK